jgi:hypothetical protein
MLRQIKSNKKGLSVMIGYVLLIVFAIITSAVVYTWIKSYVPTEELKCPDGSSILITDYSYDGSILELSIKNNGKFSLGGFFIHATNASDQEVATIDLSPNVTSGGQFSLSAVLFQSMDKDNPFSPNEAKTITFELTQEIDSIQLVPIRFQKENKKTRLVSCSEGRTREVISERGGSESSDSIYETISTQTCSELGWTGLGGGGSAECGESDASPLSACYQDKTWEQTRDLCEGAGARLCTQAELIALAVEGTGCSHDFRMIWTNTECGSNGFYLVSGDNAADPAEYCEEDLGTTIPSQHGTYAEIGVRCCADEY